MTVAQLYRSRLGKGYDIVAGSRILAARFAAGAAR